MPSMKIFAGAVFVAAALTQGAWAAPPEPYKVTDELIAAAKKEGTVVYYETVDLQVATKIVAAFEAKYPGVKIQVERAGSERQFQRIGQEYSSGIHNADLIETSDSAHFLEFKDQHWLAAAQPEDVAKLWPDRNKDPDGMYAALRGTLTVIAYRTDMVKEQDAPKTWADLLDPKYKKMMVKAHPAYAGNNMTSTYALSRLLGWDYFQKLGQQGIMQVQSATEPPKVLEQGERPIQADGNEYLDILAQGKGVPIKIVYPPEGVSIAYNNVAVLLDAPHPNAARLFYAYLFSEEAQQLSVDFGGRTVRPDVKDKPGTTPLSQIKVLDSDPVAVRDAMEEIKQKYEEYFGT